MLVTWLQWYWSAISATQQAELRFPDLRRHHVLRESERARNIHALVDVCDQTSNQMARVAAAKALEGIDDPLPAGFADPRQQPSITIRIISPNASPMVDVTPVPKRIDRS